ncbi:hypothetical protein [Streptomyces sp. NPDC001675]
MSVPIPWRRTVGSTSSLMPRTRIEYGGCSVTNRSRFRSREGRSTTTPDTRAADGQAVQKRIVGDEAVDARYANSPDDQRHIQRFLSANCFGDHYTRGGLDIPARDLLWFAGRRGRGDTRRM